MMNESRLVPSDSYEDQTPKSEQNESLDFFDVDQDTYPRAFNVLQQQSVNLSDIKSNIHSIKDGLSEKELQQLQYLEYLIQSLENSDFGSVFLCATNTIPTLQNVVSSSPTNTPLCQVASSLLSIVLKLSRIFSFVSCTLPTSVSQSVERSKAPQNNPEEENSQPDEMMVLCRICEEYVPIDLIEEHSKSCVIAYESEFNLITTDERIKKLQKAIRNSILNEKWPGAPSKNINVLLPMLHVTMLLDVATSNSDQLSHAADAIFKMEIPDATPNVTSFLAKAKELMQEKIRANATYTQALQNSAKTRCNGTFAGAQSLQTTIADFTFIRKISSGAFAKVFLAIKTRTGDIYAIKVTPKSSLKQKNTFKRVLTEKDILLQNSNPFIVDFYYSIIGDHNLYLVMEYLPGGDLYSLLNNIGSLDETAARIYTAQIVKALEYLHSHGIVHRDLKPDNILINISGKLKLTDFGLSLYGAYDRAIPDDSKTIVGTPDYLAPEIILSSKHSFTADYWSLGCVIYEFLTGAPPFHMETEMETFAQILTGRFDIDPLEDMSDEVIDLIKHLLQVDPEKRLGFNGIKEIMDHPWFAGLDWDAIDDLEPVFVPEPKDKYSVDYFTERYNFEKDDEIENDILDDIERAKTQTPHSVSMTDLSSRNSFASRLEFSSEEDSLDSDEDMASFPSIALQNLSRKATEFPLAPVHRRASSVDKRASFGVISSVPSAPQDLTLSKSFASKVGSASIIELEK